MEYESYLGLLNIILLILSGWIAAIFGPSTRYFFFIAGGALGISAISSGWYWGILIFSILLALSYYMKAMKTMQDGNALSHVISTVANSTSGYFAGVVFGLIIALVKWFFS